MNYAKSIHEIERLVVISCIKKDLILFDLHSYLYEINVNFSESNYITYILIFTLFSLSMLGLLEKYSGEI